MVAHSEENLYWLTQQPYPVAVMSKGPLGPVTLNKGNEAECYLHFIVEHYHHLPRRMVFTHGHRSAWHLPALSDALLRALIPADVQFASLVPFHYQASRFRDPSVASVIDPTAVGYVEALFHEARLDRWLPSDLMPTQQTPMAMHCCATMLVSRERILARPLEMYQALYQWLERTRLPPFAASRAFEYSWHVLFGEPWVCPLTNSTQLYNMKKPGLRPGELPPLAFGLQPMHV